ncbi:ArnT family glycosyltransferase [Patescibacteria group bacterium]
MKLFIIILFLGLAATRFINLTSIPIFGDESLYLSLAYSIKENFFINWLNSIQYGVLPVFIWFQSLIHLLLGQFTNPLFLARAFSISTDLISAAFVYLIAKKLINQKYALFSALIYLSLPLTFFHSRLSLLETTTNMFIVMAIYLSLQKKLSKLQVIVLTLIIGLAFFTKPLAIISFFPIITAPLLINKLNFKLLTRHLISFFLAALVIAVFYLPIRHKLSMFITPHNLISSQAFDLFKSNLWKTLAWSKTYITLPLGLSVLIGIIISLFKKLPQLIWIIFWLTQTILISNYFGAYFFPRHLFLLAPPVALLNGYFFYHLFKIKPLMAYLVLFFSLLPALYLNSQIILNPNTAAIVGEDKEQLYQNWNSGVGLEEISQNLKDLSSKQKITVLVENDPSLVWPLQYLYSIGNTNIIPFDDFPQDLSIQQPTYLILALGAKLPSDYQLTSIASYLRGSNYSIDLFQLQP